MTIRWGIIGCGNVCEVKSAPGMQRAEGSELLVVMRRDAALAADYARRHGVPRWSDQANAVLQADDVDAVYVATPVGTHLEYALAAAAAGKPAYVEKPMARNYAECLAMVEAFAAAGMPLFVAYYRRRLPRFLKTKELIETGRIGLVTGVSYRLTLPQHRGIDPANLPWWLVGRAVRRRAVHGPGQPHAGRAGLHPGPADGCFRLGRQPRRRLRRGRRRGHDLPTPSGALGTASWNFASHAGQDHIEIIGTEGRVSLSTFGDDPVVLVSSAGDEQFPLPNPPHIQQPLIQTIVDGFSAAAASAPPPAYPPPARPR